MARWVIPAPHEVQKLCEARVKVEVAVLGAPVADKPGGFCGR